MKNFIILCFTAILIIAETLCGEIFEIDHFKEVEKYVQPGSSILIDIGQTLLVPVQELGTGHWLKLQIKQYQEAGVENGANKAKAEWRAINMLSAVKMVEEGSNQVVERLQKQKHIVMALTKEGLTIAETRTEQLKALGFDFTLTAPYPKGLYLNHPIGLLYRQGILFTDNSNKGDALLAFFDQINHTPKHVLMIDDERQNLEDVERALKGRNTSFTGLRYTFEDEHKASFNPQIANIEFEKSNFSYILSDAEAAKLLPPPHTSTPNNPVASDPTATPSDLP